MTGTATRPPVVHESSAESWVARIGLACYRRRWVVLAGTVLSLAVLWALAGAVGGQFGQSLSLPGTESQAAVDRLQAAGFDVRGIQGGTIVVYASDGVADGRVRDSVASLVSAVEQEMEEVQAADPFASPGLVSDDGTVALVRLDFAHEQLEDAIPAAQRIRELAERLDLPVGTSVEFGGDLFTEEPDFSSTGFGLVAAAVILFVAFGSLLAMGLPLATAVIAISAGVAVVQLASRWMDIPAFVPAAVVMIGLGAGTNYALFIVTRYREELAGGHDPATAVGLAMGTAGKAALFAGATVVSSLLAMLVFGIDDVRSLALSIVAGVLFVMIASVTLLPALLGFVRGRIDRFGLPHRLRTNVTEQGIERSVWFRWSQLVQRRPLPLAVAAAVLLLLLAAPVATLRLGLADASTRAEEDTTRRAHELIADGFGEGFNGPVILAVSLLDQHPDSTVPELGRALSARSDVAQVLPPVVSEDVALIQVIPASGPQNEATVALVRDLRAGAISDELGAHVDVLVGGAVAAGIDFADINAQTLPWFIGLVLLVAFVLLAVVFRSLVVPLKAIVVNMLTVGAAYGVVVAVFQWGWLGSWFGVGQPGPIEPWVPMMLFAVTFGLSIDYEVFLLSRIRERFDQTGDNSTAVAHGLSRSARLIFAAAAIMVCVFGAFAFLANRELQILGLGLAVAIAVDATLVRLVLVPTTLELLGSRNWWLPSWLQGRRATSPGTAR